MLIRRITEADREDWLRLRDALWPGSRREHDLETRAYFETPSGTPIVFVAEIDNRIVGVLELEYRKYAPGCASSPVPFIEGWYVEPSYRVRGVGRALVAAAEAYARTEGFAEMASDADVANAGGIAAHRAVGYAEVERVVCFRRSL